MRRGLSMLALAAMAVAGLAAAGVFTSSTASAKPKPKVVKVTVVMTEFRFALSRRSVPAGTTVVFKVVNRGKISHDFKIAGKKTKILGPGKSATLTVKFAKKGRYAYRCTIPGHAAAGMKGVFAVGVAAVKPPPAPTTTATTGTSSPPPTTTAAVGAAQTTVTVGMFEYRFDLTQSTIPSGHVTFVIVNKGQLVHNFSITGVKVGKLLSPGQSETWTVALPPGSYNYQCDVPFHAGYGMVGSFTVTP